MSERPGDVMAPAAPAEAAGWPVLAAISVSTMLVMGSTTYAFGLFVKPVGAELGLGRAQMNTGAALISLFSGLFAPVIGRLIDRWPPRWVVVCGAASYAAGFVILSLATLLPVMVAAIALVAAGMLATGTLMANTLAARWFVRRRGLAMVIAAIAASAGGAIVVPLIGVLIGAVGWRRALLIEAGVAGVLIAALGLALIRNPPHGHAAARASRAADPVATRVWRLPEILGSRNFWLLALGIGLVFGIDGALLTTLVPYGTDRGFSVGAATLLVSCLTASAIGGKLVIATVIDRLDRRLLLCVVIAFNLIFVTALLLNLSYPLLLTACCIVGLSVGGTAPLWYALAADCFGQRSYASVMGLMNVVVMLFVVVATRFVGEVFDRAGTYDLAFKVFLIGSALSTLCIVGIRRSPSARVPAAA